VSANGSTVIPVASVRSAGGGGFGRGGGAEAIAGLHLPAIVEAHPEVVEAEGGAGARQEQPVGGEQADPGVGGVAQVDHREL